MSAPLRGRAEVDRLKRQLDATFARISAIEATQLELRSDFSRYLCILVSGYLERAIQELGHQWARKTSSASVASYVGRQLSRFLNPNAERICELVGAFDQNWRMTLETTLTSELRAASSVVGNRNQISHGETVGVSYVWVKDYYEQVQSLVEALQDFFDPQ